MFGVLFYVILHYYIQLLEVNIVFVREKLASEKDCCLYRVQTRGLEAASRSLHHRIRFVIGGLH